ncbi:hypothetical protein CSAL01_10747 [Colletotrichum salicis]|uniref:Major facilitator superfamily transporter n=1 Tax=Colletotrichum salicis TaxID=1209931 RepID=A0A135UPE8_9PEZI|nr:hypothetical protein CSAL01_10747 [Colletotrichum salicis]
MPDYQRDGITPDQISNLFTRFRAFFLGLGNLVSMPIAVAVGRRPVILASNVLLFLAAVLCATNRNYYWHLGGRMVAAFAAAQCQALALLIMQDIYFLHQQARVFQIYASAEVLLNSSLASQGLSMILTFFFVPETAYDRPIEAFMGSHPADRSNLLPAVQTTGPDTIIRSPLSRTKVRNSRREARRRLGTLQRPHFYFTPTNLRVQTHLVPLLALPKTNRPQVFLFPHVLWVAVNNGLFQGNRRLDPNELGQVFIALLCVPLIGWLSDYVIRSSARRNHGVHEPEKRLIAWIPPHGDGSDPDGPVRVRSQEPPERYRWMAIVSVVDGYLIVLMGVSTVGTAYLIDSHPSFAGAILVALPVTRGLVGFGLSKHTMTYIANIGPVKTFGIYAAVSAAFCLLGVVLFFKGKKVRRLSAQMTQ